MKTNLERFFSSFVTTIVLLLIYAFGLAVATFIEKYHGTATAKAMVYYSPLFFLLQFLLVVNFIAATIKHQYLKRGKWGLMLTHFAFIIILLGALTSFLFGEEGILHLREGETSNQIAVRTSDNTTFHTLPFSVELKKFTLTRYPGSASPSSYESEVIVHVDGEDREERIFMNNVLDVKGYRFFQASYDQDEHGTILSVNRDVAGRNITYTGYLLLVIGLILCLVGKDSRFMRQSRRLKELRKATNVAVLLLALLAVPLSVNAGGKASPMLDAVQKYAVSPEHAALFGALPIQSGSGRMMPVNTFSSEILRKLHKSDKIGQLNSDQFLLSLLAMPEGGTRSFTFDLEVQPILDRACIACHNGEGKAFDLRGGKKDKLGYGTSYLNLHPYVHRQGGEGDMVVLQPYEYHPNTSELVRLLKKGHHNVKLTDKEWKTLYNWIDYNAPDKGYFNANVLTDLPYKGFDQIKRRKELTDKYANGAGVDWKKEIADYADYLKKQGPITPVMPEKAAPVKEKTLKVKGWPFGADRIKEMLAKEKETRKVVEIAPGVKVNFVRIPAGEFVMGSYRGEPDAYPTAKVKIDKAFWMAELETTNEQFNVVFPDHDSRFVDQQWKDHVVQGYPANKPEQPVIRVSYNDAMEFCRKLSEKTGLKITLPTEAQWEWACRAGSDQDFWYGDMHADFGKKDNLADKTTLLFAVYGVDPQPMAKTNPWYKYYTFLPKEESVDDGNLVQVGGKAYEANPFGLYSMHGNVAEWTRSDYVSYPYNEKTKETSEYKVARGGSYIDRPKYAASHTRKAYYPYQRVFNVGFRMIIED